MQLPAPLIWTEKRHKENFFVGACNREAYHAILSWDSWEFPMLLLVGGKGSGKTHLASIWEEESKAQFVSQQDLLHESLLEEKRCYIVDDIMSYHEEDLFHFYNSCVQRQCFVLFTAQEEDLLPEKWRIVDWYSRLIGLPRFMVTMPDEDVVLSILMKMCDERGIVMPPRSFSYLTRVLPRSFGVVSAFVDGFDRYLLSSGERATLASVKKFFLEFEQDH